MKKGIIILTILFIVTLSFAGWKKVFHRYSFRDAVQTTDGNFLVIGDKWGDFPTTKSYLYWRHIYRETGLTIPGREYKDSDDSDGYFVIKTKDKGYLITGKDYITGKIIAIKLDSSFSLQWRKMHGRPGDVGAPITCCTQEGGYFLFHSLGYYRYRFNLIKLDSLGDSIWIRDYDSLIGTPPDSYDTYPRFVVNTLDRNYILGLHIRCAWIPYLDTSYLFIKIDESGDIIWTKSSDIIYTESSCHPTFDSSFIHVGYDYLPDHEIVVTKYDREFDTILWRKTYCYKKVPLDIIQTSDSGFVIFGGKPDYDSIGTYLGAYMFLMKLDSNGDSLWCHIFERYHIDYTKSFLLLDDGGFLMVGTHKPNSILILTDSLGDVRVTESPLQKPEEFSITVSPNPFNSSCQIIAPEAATVTIFDLRGRLVSLLSSHVEGHKALNSKRSYIWQPEQSVSSGIYIVKVSTDNRSTSKKYFVPQIGVEFFALVLFILIVNDLSKTASILGSIAGAKVRRGYRFPFGGWIRLEHRWHNKIGLLFIKSEGLFLTPLLPKVNGGWCSPLQGFYLIESGLAKNNLLVIKFVREDKQRYMLLSRNSFWNLIVTNEIGKILWIAEKSKKNSIGNVISIPEYNLVPPTESLKEILPQGIEHFENAKEILLHKIIHRELKQKLKRNRNALIAVRGDYEKLGNPERNHKLANAIMANLHIIKPHSHFAKITDPYSGETIQIELDPKLSPIKYAESLYKKARRAKRGKEKIITRYRQLLKTKRNLIKLSELDNIYETTKELNIDVEATLGESEKDRKTQKEEKLGPSIKRMFSSDGFEILIGKSAESNNRLTFKISAKTDIWLHAESIKGSHVIIRAKGAEIPNTTLLQAAMLAAFYSDSKHSSLVPVIYTERKYVHPIRGHPGKVRIDRSKTLMIEPKGVIAHD